MEGAEGNVAKWRAKFEGSEKNLLQLKRLSHKERSSSAVSAYDELLRKYDQNQKAYEDVCKRLEERETQLKQLQSVLEPIYDEYNALELRYKIEKDCRSQAELYASKMHQQNNKLKRQSQLLLGNVMTSVDFNLDELKEITEEETEEELNPSQHLSKMIESLEQNLASLTQRLEKAEEDREIAEIAEEKYKRKLEDERTSHSRTQTQLQHYSMQLNQFKRVSSRAVSDYDQLQTELELEKMLKEKAEEHAIKMSSERNAMARQSSALITSAASDEKLANALQAIETLTTELEAEKKCHHDEVAELQKIIDSSQDVHEIDDLDERLSDAVQQIENLQTQLNESLVLRESLEKELQEATTKLEESTTNTEDATVPPTAPPAPPPPPPPPPPLPCGNLFKPLKPMMKKSDKPKEKAKPEAESYEKAVQEMMDRIKSGTKSLRPVNKAKRGILEKSPSLPEMKSPGPDNTAMNELHKMLHASKARRGSLDSMDAPHSPLARGGQHAGQEENELTKIFNRMKTSAGANLSKISEEASSQGSIDT